MRKELQPSYLWLEHGDDDLVISLPLLLVIIQVNKGIDKSEKTSRNILARRKCTGQEAYTALRSLSNHLHEFGL